MTWPRKGLVALNAGVWFFCWVGELVTPQPTRCGEILVTVVTAKRVHSCVGELCVFRLPTWEKVLLHWLQEKSISPVCDILCLFRLLNREKVLLHCSQSSCFSSMRIILCLLRLLGRDTVLLHWSQAICISPATPLKAGNTWSLCGDVPDMPANDLSPTDCVGQCKDYQHKFIVTIWTRGYKVQNNAWETKTLVRNLL